MCPTLQWVQHSCGEQPGQHVWQLWECGGGLEGAQIGGCEMQATLRWHWTYNRKVYSQTLHFLGVVKPCACVVTFGANMFRSRSSKVIVSHIAHSRGKCGNMGECSRRCPLVSLLDHNDVGTCEFGQGQQTWEQMCGARVMTFLWIQIFCTWTGQVFTH